MNCNIRHSDIASIDSGELDLFMNRCSRVAADSCHFIDDALLDAIHFDDRTMLSSCLSKNSRLVSARNNKGQTLLHIAAARNRHRCVETLLQHGADTLAVEDESGWTPLHAALYRGSLLAAKLLLLHQKSAALSVLDNEGNIPFDLVLPMSGELGHASNARHVLVSFGCVNNLQLGVVSDSPAKNRPKSLDALLNEDMIQFDLCEIGGAAVSASGSAFSWGVNKNGRLGVGDDASRIRPHSVPLPLSSDKHCIAVACSLTHSVFLLSNGEVYTCGKGYLGHDPLVKGQQQSLTPRRIEKGLKKIKVVGISCSKFRTCLVTDSGEALLLGYHMADEGIDYSPTKIDGLPSFYVVQMLTTNCHWLVLTSDGDLFEQTRRERRFFRVPISRISKKDASRPGVVQFATCKTHSVAVTSDGTLWAWPSRAVKGGSPDSSLRPVQPRQVKAVRSIVVTSASTTLDHTACITAAGHLIEWEHDPPNFYSTTQRLPSDWLSARSEKVARLSHPRQLNQVVCAPGCTLVSQEYRLVDRDFVPIDKHKVLPLLKLCEIAFCSVIDERRVIAAFRFAFNANLQLLLDYCTNFIITNSQILLFNALRELESPELEYIQSEYQKLLPNSISRHSNNEKPPTLGAIDEDLEWFVPHTVRHLRVRIRSSLKKLSQISVLSERLANGEKLNSEQVHKIKQKDRLRLFLQQCQGALALKLEPDPILEIVKPSANDPSDVEEIVTIVRAQGRHSESIWQEPLCSTPTDYIWPSNPAPEVCESRLSTTSDSQCSTKVQPSPPSENVCQGEIPSWSEVSSPGSCLKEVEKPVFQSSLSFALKQPSSPKQTQFRQKPRRSNAKLTSNECFSAPGNLELSSCKKPASSPVVSTDQGPSVSLADFWSISRSSPINITSRSKTHSMQMKQGCSPVSSGSPWNVSSAVRTTKSFAEIQNEDASKVRSSPAKSVRESRPPWGAHSPPVSSFAGIIQEELALKSKFPEQNSFQPRSCWGPQTTHVKPSSIECIQSLQFIQEELDREAQEAARTARNSNQRQKKGNRYKKKLPNPQQQCHRNSVLSESGITGNSSRTSVRY